MRPGGSDPGHELGPVINDKESPSGIGSAPNSSNRKKRPIVNLITLTSDFGTSDGFVGQMKGVILGIYPTAAVVDVTHDISPFSILQGALVIKGTSRYFPAGTIHLAVVDPGVGSSRRAVALRSDGQYYVGPDNGLFSLVITQASFWEMREIDNPDLILPRRAATFHGRDVFAPVAAHLAAGVPFSEIGSPVVDPVMLQVPVPARIQRGISGEVVYVDRFGNCSSNIETAHLQSVVASVEIANIKIIGIKSYFGQVPKGAPLAYVNSFGFLEVAVNQGDAAQSLGVRLGDRVTVRWD